VVVIDPTQETMAINVINEPTCATTKLNAIDKIHKYKRLHERHHFILMAMEVHGTKERGMDRFIKKCFRLFHDRQLKGHLSLYFCIQFFRQRVSIAFYRALASTIKKKIVLA